MRETLTLFLQFREEIDLIDSLEGDNDNVVVICGVFTLFPMIYIYIYIY
jgi:hypothetical protein